DRSQTVVQLPACLAPQFEPHVVPSRRVPRLSSLALTRIRQRLLGCRIFTPAQPSHSAASSEGFLLRRLQLCANAQETARMVLSANIVPAAARESDLFSFEIGIEQGRPHAVMCAYNRVNGTYSCENDFLLNQVLRRDWAYPGFVMSDWGAVHSTEKAATSGLDQESGEEMDSQVRFGTVLKEAVETAGISP